MRVSRRALLAGAAAPLFARHPDGLKIGVMDGVLRQSGKPAAIALAKSFGAEGVQVTLGKAQPGSPLPLEDAALQAQYREEAKRHGIPIAATYLDVLHVNCLKDDKAAPEWIRRGIAATKALEAPVLMTVFFGKCSLANRAEMDTAAGAFRELAREAERAKVVLGFENLLNAEDNMRVMDQVKSPAFKIWYDVGNSTNQVGVDAAKEIRLMGRDRICQLHFKDKGYLGEGAVNLRAVLDALAAIGFRGFAHLETSAPSGQMEPDLRRNLAYLRGLMEQSPAAR
jgi:sugar phosphate isomerase/epimerase